MRILGVVAVGAAALLLSGCGAGGLRISDDVPAERTPYTGPLVATPSAADRRTPWEWPGAAGRVVSCSSAPRGQTVVGRNDEGAVAADPQAAIEVKRGEGLFLSSPTDALVRERDDGDRVLFTTSYDGVARQAIIVRDGPSGPGTGAKDGHGWYVESFATCDLADFPESVSRARGVQVWTDADGTRVPTSTVVSADGPAHCAWQSMTFLTLGDGTKDPVSYVARPLQELGEYFDRPYREHVRVPSDARDTGWRREGRRIWIAADGRSAYVGAEDDAAAWPRPARPLGCA
ncbi:hypothetical protein [Amnibacterium setariae]|nr:hypothetical protein [Amnibacterium setariae]